MSESPKVLIVMGSDSDLPVMEEAKKALDGLGIPNRITVASAHRSPQRAMKLASEADKEGIAIIIAGAGGRGASGRSHRRAHGVAVIGVPIDSSPLQGWDALLATVQMPPGVPVATMGVGKSGAKNAGLLAAQILALRSPELKKRLLQAREDQVHAVEEKALAVERKYAE